LTFVRCNNSTNKKGKRISAELEKEIINEIHIKDTTEIEKEEFYRKKINAEFDKKYSECKYPKNGISNLNGKKEFWKLCELKNENQIFEINSHKGTVYYKEIYFSKNGKLIYAKEIENYMPENSFSQMDWNCQFYIKNDSLYTLITHGIGNKDENWNANIILEMFEKRKKELKILNKNNG